MEIVNGVYVWRTDQSILLRRHNEVFKYASDHKMRINISKSKVISSNFWSTRFKPELRYNLSLLDVVTSAKILGVICSSDGSWSENINYLAGKANKRIYFLRRLKKLGASNNTLKDVYCLFVRSLLEFCAPLWAGNWCRP